MGWRGFSIRPEAVIVTANDITKNWKQHSSTSLGPWPLSLSLEVDHEADVNLSKMQPAGPLGSGVLYGDTAARMCLTAALISPVVLAQLAGPYRHP